MTPKAKIPVTIRVDQADIAEWTRQAKLCGISISEWIRRACNRLIPSAAEVEAGERSIRRMEGKREDGEIVSVRRDVVDRTMQEFTENLDKVIAAPAHDLRCSCLACKPQKKEKVKV